MWEQNQPIALISIHAPTRGATCGEFEVLYPNIISIHAPTRGATLTDPIALATAIYFNPRSYKRSDIFF